jgi:two-component system, NtrC family, sensor kinase
VQDEARAADQSAGGLKAVLAHPERELAEAREREAATTEILKIISSSPGNLQPVFDAIAQSAARLLRAHSANVTRIVGDEIHLAAFTAGSEEAIEAVQASFPSPMSSSGIHSRVARSGEPAFRYDIEAEPDVPQAVKDLARTRGYRSILVVPMMRGSHAIGTIGVTRSNPGPFSSDQVDLLKTFAAQAVIAIENTRLLNELRQRTDDLSESLEQQTATSEVLRVISRSPTNVQPVFDAIAESAVRLCGGQFSFVVRFDGKVVDFASCCGLSAEGLKAFRRLLPHPASEDTAASRAILRRAVVEIPDVGADPAYGTQARELAKTVIYRSIMAVPLLHEGNPIGAIAVARANAGVFPKRQIVLLQGFADQAVIAIENVRLFDEVQARTRDVTESLQQQTATADVLKVISSTPGKLEPVFETMLAKAAELCEASYGTMWLREGDGFRAAALHGALPPAFEQRSGSLFRPGPDTTLARIAQTRTPIQVADLAKSRGYLVGDPFAVAGVDVAGIRTLVSVPMLKESELVGVISVYRKEVRPFTHKQIELVKNFADQAVIAIENTRLLNELRESLQQQTATADVLKVISSSPGDLQPVFEAMLENATRICDAKFGNIYRWDGNSLHLVATHNTPPALAQSRRSSPFRPGPETPTGRMVATKSVTRVADLALEPGYVERDPLFVEGVEVGGIRTLLSVPMVKENELIGAFSIYRDEVRPFTDKQIELVQIFADQAVIAIENVRLFDEVQARTRDLSEALEQQTATADVLKVISSSATDLQPTFETIASRSVSLCGATYGVVYRFDGEMISVVAHHNLDQPALDAMSKIWPMRPDRERTLIGQVIVERSILHISDVAAESRYTFANTSQKALGIRSFLGVPMLRDGSPIGAIALYRREVGLFSERQIELVKAFADQAVIAVENVRLLNELRESLQQQTATADVLKVISRSTFDLQTVLQTLVESAARLCDADRTNITRQKNGVFYRAEAYGFSREFMDYVRNIPIQPGRGSAFGRALLEGRAVHIPDVKTDPEYTLVEGQRLGDYRTVLAVPMLREGVTTGVLSLTRSEVRPFTDKQIELATTFADQAAIAIENVRLFESVEARTRELAASLENLRTTQDRLVQTQKLASLGQLTAGIAHEIKNPLNFVNNFSGVSAELIDELQEALKDVSLNDKRRDEITELMDTLRGNLDKVVQHGKRADAIVKNMLLHSREGSGEHRLVDINALVEEGLNLAYHGARAEKQGFNITMEKSLDPTAGQVDVFPHDITRVLLNLISNGFYAATKRKAEANGGDYEPTLAASTKNLGDRVEISIRDNGTGIPPEVKEKMFNPFFTTKPAGEGTGLGLSISHDIVVKQHGGSIEVDTQPGEFTEFRIVLPRAAVFLAESGGQG